VTTSIATNQTILVVGGGIGGMTAALEAAECGKQVILAERNTSLEGRTALLYRYFPKMCHPTCGLENNLRRLKANRNLKVMAPQAGNAGGILFATDDDSLRRKPERS
jgi:quinone-modifying oxidoreductase subunit QmoA